MKHKFAIFNKQLSIAADNKIATIKSLESVNRIVNILRLDEGEDIVIFDKSKFYELKIIQITKRDIRFEILSSHHIERQEPQINLVLGLLKKDNFEKALYNAALLSIKSIQPVYTDLMHKNWWSDKYLDRLESVMASACEQSKNFAMPEILSPINLSEYLQKCAPVNLLVCDTNCPPLAKVKLLRHEYTLLIGPEAGFSLNEIGLLQNYPKYSLVNAVLTSYDAVFAAGIIMSNLA